MTSQNPSALNGKTSISNHPFIWGNIAFLAGVPWLLTLSMAGLAVGDPVFPTWLEISLLGFPAIAAVVWLQWQQPFSPFSLWFLVKPSESLSEDERRVLTLVKQQRNGWYVTGWLAIAVAFVISAIFCKLYIAAPLAQAIAPFPAGLRLFGIIWAEICFLLSNVLLQSGISALRIKLTAESEINSLQPFAIEKIRNNFTNIGWQVPQLLKFFEEALIPEIVEEKDVPQESITEQTQDVVEQSQDVEISDAAEETVTEPSQEVVESVDEDFEVNNFTEEVVAEEVEITPEVEIQGESNPELSLEIAEPISEKLVAEDDAIAVQEESNISEFEVDALVELTTEAEVNLGEELIVEESEQPSSEVVADIHDDTLAEVAEAIVNEAPEESVNGASIDQLEATSEFDESTHESIEESEVISEVIDEVIDNDADLGLEELSEAFASQEVANNIVEEITEASEELEIDEDISDASEALDLNEVVVESELEISEDLDGDAFTDPTPEEATQEEFNEPDSEVILDITEDISKSESQDIAEDTFDTSSDISDIKLDTQETANDVTEDSSLDLPVIDNAAELEIDESDDSADEETLEVNLDNPFTDITEELAVDNFDVDTNEEITDLSDEALEIVEPDLEAIASFTDKPNAETSEIVEESSISEIADESDDAIALEPVDVATDGSVEDTEEFAINEVGDLLSELSDDVSAESAVGTNLEINANLLDTQSIEDQISETNTLEINEPSQGSESDEIIDFVDNPVDSDLDGIAESDEGKIDTLETVDDAIIETNNSIETDSTTEAKSQKSKKSIDLFRKSRKKGFSQKNYGFGRSAKTITTNETATDQVEASVEDDELEVGDIVSKESVESRFDIADANLETEEIVEEVTNALVPEIELEAELEIDVEAIASSAAVEPAVELDMQVSLPLEQVETPENKSSDFDEELDELIAFNAYVENILAEYLGDSNEEIDDENQEVEDIIEISSVSEQATEIAEEVLIAEEILETAIPELIEPPATIETTEAIAQDSQETTLENNPEHKDPKYLVQEFLVDKFLAKLEELNNADKANKPNTENTELITETPSESNSNNQSNSVLDEFADLEALLNRKPLSDNPE